jgi:site-specific DNA-methyltransferase (adenine-specific)
MNGLLDEERHDRPADRRASPCQVPDRALDQPRGTAQLIHADARSFYATWPSPTVIISDGAYGVGGFPGDPPSPDRLPTWYAEHLRDWTEAATAETTLWFWSTEIGWATMHPHITAHGWVISGVHTWDKGLAYVAGRNTRRLRGLPIVTETCARYTRPPAHRHQVGMLQAWLRQEWQRTGLPWQLANTACGVKGAATRTYLAADRQWYCPSDAMTQRLADYANRHGDPAGWPYFAAAPAGDTDTASVIQRAMWHPQFGVTNVWSVPAVRGRERVRGPDGRALHRNQKPMALFALMIRAASNPNTVVWEPFGGLAPAAVVSVALGRHCSTAEQDARLVTAARARLQEPPIQLIEHGRSGEMRERRMYGR